MPTISGRDVPFDEAIDFFKKKVRLPTRAWTDLWEGMHSRAFVVAGAQKDALLADFKSAIEKALEKGTTLEEFRNDFDRIVATHGWSYKGGRGWRSRVIFQTNLRTAYQAGRWEQIQRLKDRRPYLRYVAVLDTRTRPEHRAWHGTVLPADDAFWQTHYPPNGWNCRCTVQQLSDRDLQRFGFEESKEAPPVEPEPRQVNTPAGPVTIRVPKGIDPGFAYNPGIGNVGEAGGTPTAVPRGRDWTRLSPGDWRSHGRPAEIPLDEPRARLGPPPQTRADAIEAVERAIGGPSAVVRAPDGSGVEIVAERLGGHMRVQRAAVAPFLRELIEDPFEIWATFERHRRTGQVVLRKRFVKAVPVGRDRFLLMVVQLGEGRFETVTFIPMRDFSQLNKQRVGFPVWVRERS